MIRMSGPQEGGVRSRLYNTSTKRGVSRVLLTSYSSFYNFIQTNFKKPVRHMASYRDVSYLNLA